MPDMTTTEARADDAYGSLLSLAAFDDTSLRELLTAHRDGVDLGDLLERYDTEHVTGLAGRVEGRVYKDEDTPHTWIAEPYSGSPDPQRFSARILAVSWLHAGGQYGNPVPAVLTPGYRKPEGCTHPGPVCRNDLAYGTGE